MKIILLPLLKLYLDSIFKNNSDFNTTMNRSKLKRGGAISFKGNFLKLKNIYGYGNSGMNGGFLFLDFKTQPMQDIIISFSIFQFNIGFTGGVIGTTTLVNNIRLAIYNNYFFNNFGSSKLILIVVNFI